MSRLLLTVIPAFGLMTCISSTAAAQSSAPIGVRASGMGGAFTAVADDGTAPYWNPAGLASGAYVGLTIDVNSLDRQSGAFVGLATPPLGLSYFRTSISTVGADKDRNGGGERVIVHHAGATVVQSIGDKGLSVGATLGVVHGNAATAFSADAGVMVSGGLGRAGLTVHNLTAPSLGDVRLDRRVRAGVAVNARQDLMVAADAELTKTTSARGDWRDAAVGVEAHPHTRVWLRSGVHWNTAGDVAAPIGSIGGGVAVYGSLRADAQVSFGSEAGDRGWGVGFSYVY
jgi:hypothetical protein